MVQGIELSSLTQRECRAVSSTVNRRHSKELVSNCGKIVCVCGLVVIAACITILIVTNTLEEETISNAGMKLLVIGGESSEGLTNSVEEISLGLCHDTGNPSIPDIPLNMSDIYGGYLSSGAVLICGKASQISPCFIFRSGSNKWENAGILNQAKYILGMAVVDNFAFVLGVGGLNSSYLAYEIYSDQDGRWQPGSPLSLPANYPCITRLVLEPKQILWANSNSHKNYFICRYERQVYITGGDLEGRSVHVLDLASSKEVIVTQKNRTEALLSR